MKDLNKIQEFFSKPINEDNSNVRVSKPRFRKDKYNPNFLNVYMDYDIGSGGPSMALGKETMSGQIRRLSSQEAMKQMNDIAKKLESKFDIEDIEITDLENGKVQLFAVSDDFVEIDPKSVLNEDDSTQWTQLDIINVNKVLRLAIKTLNNYESNLARLKDEMKKHQNKPNGSAIANMIPNFPEGQRSALNKLYNGWNNVFGKYLEESVNENVSEWPKEVDSRYNEYKFVLDKVMSDRAKYKVIDVKTGKEEPGGRVYNTPSQLQSAADNLIKPLGGRQSSQFEESVNEIKVDYDFSEKELVRVLRQLLRGASGERGMIQAFTKALGRDITKDELFGESINEYDVVMPSQEEVDRFFSITQNELHYLASKPVMGQEASRTRTEIEPWDEYDYSNWLALNRKAKEQGKIDEQMSMISKKRAKAELKQFKSGKRADGMGKYVAKIYGIDSDGKEHQIKDDSDLNKYEKFGILGEGSCGYNEDALTGKKLTTPGGLEETIKFIKENNPNATIEEVKKELKEIKSLGENLNEELCEKGKRYIKARQAAGEKSSAYLSGRAVKVCKGSIEWPKKSKKKK